MPGINAALGYAQIRKIKELVKAKRKLFEIYKSKFQNNEHFSIRSEPKNCKSNFWLNNLELKHSNANLKDFILRETNKNNIQTRPAWILLHELKYFKDCPKDNLNVSKEYFDKIISIPSSAGLIL